MQTLHRREVDVPSYDFGVHKHINISSYRVMIMVHVYEDMG